MELLIITPYILQTVEVEDGDDINPDNPVIPLQQFEQQSDNSADNNIHGTQNIILNYFYLVSLLYILIVLVDRPSTPAIPPHITVRPVVDHRRHGLHLNNLPYYSKNEMKWSNKPFVSNFLNISPPVPELSTTYMTLSPIEYFSKYFPEVEFENMAKFTNIYAKQNNFVKYVDTTPSEMKVFVGIHLKIGCLKHTRIRVYWTNEDRVNIIADNMSRNRFFFS